MLFLSCELSQTISGLASPTAKFPDTAWQKKKIYLHFFQHCVSNSTPLFPFALQDSLSIYFSTPLWWHISLRAPPEYLGKPGEFCINSHGFLLQIQPLKPQGDFEFTKYEELRGEQQLIVFIAQNTIKGLSRGEKSTFIMPPLFTLLA